MRLKTDLRGYQQRTVTALYERAELQAVLPMGAGKTAAALTAVSELIEDGAIRCALVLAPKKVAQLVWPNELQEWAHLQDMTCVTVSGTPLQRELLLSQDVELYVIGVDNTQWLVDKLKELPPDHRLFDCLIIDESSRFKNPRSKRARSLMKVRRHFKNVWMLTGTPRPNGYADQFKPLTLLTNGQLWGKQFDPWRETRFMKGTVERDGSFTPSSYGHHWRIRPEWEQRTVDEINTVSLTIGPDEMPELPELAPVFHWVELPPAARKAYKQMERDLLARLRDERKIAASNVAVAAGKLSQAAQGFMYGDGNTDVEHLHTEKADLLVELVEDLDENVLIAYEFVEDLRVLNDMWPGIPYLGANQKDSAVAKYEAMWNAGSLPRLALHPASAGHGLNLQHGGRHMFWYGMTWSAELFDQTTKRFHRPGQKHRCFNHVILAKDTIDEVKYDRVINKMNEQEAFLKYMRKL